jgi:ABC-type nitrate/sulfonate/bicarbonate transport system substrate-binding protein
LGFGLVTREDVIQNKPDLVARMVRAELNGLNFIRSNSAEEIADAVLSKPAGRNSSSTDWSDRWLWTSSTASSRASVPAG